MSVMSTTAVVGKSSLLNNVRCQYIYLQQSLASQSHSSLCSRRFNDRCFTMKHLYRSHLHGARRALHTTASHNKSPVKLSKAAVIASAAIANTAIVTTAASAATVITDPISVTASTVVTEAFVVPKASDTAATVTFATANITTTTTTTTSTASTAVTISAASQISAASAAVNTTNLSQSSFSTTTLTSRQHRNKLDGLDTLILLLDTLEPHDSTDSEDRFSIPLLSYEEIERLLTLPNLVQIIDVGCYLRDVWSLMLKCCFPDFSYHTQIAHHLYTTSNHQDLSKISYFLLRLCYLNHCKRNKD